MDVPKGGSFPLLGRDSDLAAVSARVSATVAEGTAGIVLIEGEPGIGKSFLLRSVVENAPPGVRVVQGHGHELERERPFGLVLDAITTTASAGPQVDAIHRWLHTDPEATGDEGFAVLRFRIIEAILDLLSDWADEHPVLLALEDLHWADPSSLLTIGQVARRLAERPVAIVATLRPSRDLSHLDVLRRELSPEAICWHTLAPLPDGVVHTMAERALGGPPGPRLVELLTGAAGNPFFVAELLAALTEDGTIEAGENGEVELTAPDPPASLRLTILRRLGFLPHRTLETLRAASLLGSRFHLDDLSIVLDRPASELYAELEDARMSGLLVDRNDVLAFRHDLVRDAIYEDLPAGARRALHVQAARRLAEAGRDATSVASHYLAGASPGDRDAVTWLERAAQDALSTAPSVAATLLTAAAELAGGRPGDRDRLEVELATALTWAGRLDEAEQLLEQLALRPHDRDVDVRVRHALARVQIIQGRATAAAAGFDELEASGALDERQQARAAIDAATARLLGGDLGGAEREANRGLELGQRLGDDPAVCGALAALAWVVNLRGDTQRAIELGEEAVALADASEIYETGRRYPHCYLATVLLDADHLDEGLRMYDVGRRLAEAYGDTWQLPIHHWGAVLTSFYRGQFQDTDAALQTAFAILDEVGTGMLSIWAHALAAHVAIRQDTLDLADERLRAAEQRMAEMGPGMGVDWLLWGRALLAEATDDLETAAATLRGAWDIAGDLGILAQRRLIGPDLVRLLLATGDVEVARDVAARMSDAADLGGVPGARAAALRCAAIVERDLEVARAAVALHREGPRRIELADACRDAGLLAADLSDEAAATELLREAAGLYHDAGAARDERQVDAALRSLGVARGRREARSRPQTGWEALTPTEVEVTRLVAEGLTNPEVGRRMFISPRTVETHLSHVFRKLGVTSRVELASKVARRP
jgi:DNA-binding CsgD family transcriptional regulator